MDAAVEALKNSLRKERDMICLFEETIESLAKTIAEMRIAIDASMKTIEIYGDVTLYKPPAIIGSVPEL